MSTKGKSTKVQSPAVLTQELEMVPVGQLKAHPANPRKGNAAALDQSIVANGFYGACVAQKSTGFILAGRHRWERAAAAGIDQVPVIWVDVDDAHARRIIAADNRTSDLALYDTEKLTELLAEINLQDGGLYGTGFDEAELNRLIDAVAQETLNEADLGGYPGGQEDADAAPARKTLCERFLVPPFSVLDARQGYWQERKRAWLALGIESELGRGDNLQHLSESNDEYRYDNKKEFFARRPNAVPGGAPMPLDRAKNARGGASPGGSPRPAMKLRDGKTVRGDGKGRELTFTAQVRPQVDKGLV